MITCKVIVHYFVILSKIVEVCLKTYDLDPTHLYSAPGLVWIAALKKDNDNFNYQAMIITRILNGYQQLIVESEVESMIEDLDIQKQIINI